MTRKTLEKRLRCILAHQLSFDAPKITLDMTLEYIDHYVFTEILVDIKIQLDVFISDTERYELRTFKDLIDIVEKHLNYENRN